MIAEPLEKGLAEDIENEVVEITWPRLPTHTHTHTHTLYTDFLVIIIYSTERNLPSFFRPSTSGIF